MGFMREFPQYLKNRLEFEQFTPLIKSQVNVVGSPTTPAALGVTSARNTAVKCEYDKRAFIACYDRLAIASVFTASMALKPVSITVTNVKRLRDLQPDLYRCLGIFPDPLEIADAAVTLNGNTVAVPVAADNPWFTGTLTVSLDTAYYTTADGTVVADLGTWDPRPFIHPTADPATRPVMNGGLLTFNVDYTSQSGVLATIPVRAGRTWVNIANTDAATLATALAAVDGIPWVCNTAGTASALYDWNLFASSVIYNGPTEAFDPLFDSGFTNAYQQYFLNYDLVDTRYTHVLIVHPNPSYGNKNLRYAPLFIHYGRKRSDAELTTAYRKPRHSWSLLDTVDSGFTPLPWPTPLTKITDADTGDWAKLDRNVVLPEPLAADINHTIAFEVMRSSATLGDNYGLLSAGDTATDADASGGVPGSIYMDTSGTIKINGTQSLWLRDGVNNALSATNIAEYHIVYNRSLVYIYINQQLCEILTAPILRFKNYLVFGKAGTAWLNTEYVRNVRYWDIALTNEQIQALDGITSTLPEEVNPVANTSPTFPALPYPKPLFEWLFQGDVKSTGRRTDEMPGIWTYTTAADGYKYGHLAGTSLLKFPPELRMRMCGDYTYDIDFDLGGAPYSYLYFLVPTSGNLGTLAQYEGRFYEYGVTPTGGGVWAATPQYRNKVRLTMRSRNGVVSYFANGTKLMEYPAAGYAANYLWAGFRNTDGMASQFPTAIGIRNFRYWEYGLTDAQLTALWYGPVAEMPLEPLHYWSLKGVTTDSGSLPAALTPAFNYTGVGDNMWASRVSSGAQPFGNNIALPLDNDFTFDIKLLPSSISGYTVLLSTNQSVVNNTGTLMFTEGRPYLAYVTGADSTTKLIAGVENRLTVRRQNNVMQMYINGVPLTNTTTITSALGSWVGFGDAEGVSRYSDPNKYRDICFWDRALDDSELAEIWSV